MEKLIELLNEYAHTYADHYDDTGEEIVIDFYKHTDQCFLYTEDGQFESLVDDVATSKRFGFIGWLVENDKIDKRKIDTRLVKNVESHYDGDGCWVENSYEDYSDTDTLLMLLSISNSPIDDLISYLK